MKIMLTYTCNATLFFVLFWGFAFAGQHYTGKTGYGQKTGGMNMDFKSIDADSSGSLDPSEYKTAFPSSSRKGFDFLDKDNDGLLTPEEWRKFKEMHKGMGKYHKKSYHGKEMPDLKSYNAHFGDIDTNSDDAVTPDEFNAYFKDHPKKEKVFKGVDLDNGGTIDHDEWHQYKEAHGMTHTY